MLPLSDWIAALLSDGNMLRMGHAQRRADLNLGLGWLYYALGRVIRPLNVVVIGSFRGFVPLVIARALLENSESGNVHFIDPSHVDDFWKDPMFVKEYFLQFGVTNVVHYLMTTQEFVESPTYRQLDRLGLVFIDGYHSAAQAKFDFDAFAEKVVPTGMILLHDSIAQVSSLVYGREEEYVRNVVDFIADLKQSPRWQVLDIPFGEGVTIVKQAMLPEI